MDTKKRKKMVYAIFIAASIWGLYNFIGGEKRQPKTSPALVKAVQQTITARKPVVPIDIDKYSKFGWGRDPFYRAKKAPVRQKPEAPPTLGWILGGILYNDNNPSAVINKKIVRHGDIVNGARVVKIGKNMVKLEKDGSQFTLNIEKDKS